RSATTGSGARILRAAIAAILLTFVLSGCATVMKAAGYPPNPTRAEPPPGISSRALAVGSPAPEFSLPATTGGTWSLRNALREGPVIVLFYRGHW
ncbi:MAG TPA: hypothetical protein VE782_09110, partial [Myxococcaceae bacterium]|nr:hypothetical protein [Myxococcaceae bacterium]